MRNSSVTIVAIREAVGSTTGVEGIIHLKTMHVAPEELLVAAKIAVSEHAGAVDVAETIDAAERAMRVAEPMATQVFLEPDIQRDEYVPDERPEVPEAPGH